MFLPWNAKHFSPAPHFKSFYSVSLRFLQSPSLHSILEYCPQHWLHDLDFRCSFYLAIQGSVWRDIKFAFCLFFSLYGWGYLNAGWCDRREILAQGRANTRDGNKVVWGLAAPGGRKKRQMKFSLLWESIGNFCILAVFERYLSNACTDPHQILFV